MRALLLSLALSACGVAVPDTSPELVEYAATFEREAKIRGLGHKAVPMVLVKEFSVEEKRSSVRGLCIKRGHSRWIEIKESFFKSSFKSDIEVLVMHELGHCVLDLKHSHSKTIDLMKPFIMYGHEYRPFRDHYLDELFDTVQK